MSNIPGFLTVYEAAKRLGVSHSQVTRYIHNDLLAATKIGQQMLIPEISLSVFKRPPRGNPAFLRKKKKSLKN